MEYIIEDTFRPASFAARVAEISVSENQVAASKFPWKPILFWGMFALAVIAVIFLLEARRNERLESQEEH